MIKDSVRVCCENVNHMFVHFAKREDRLCYIINKL